MYKKSLVYPTIFLACFTILISSACQESKATEQSVAVTTTEALIATETPSPEQQKMWSIWSGSPHAHTYALEKGPNTYCARCHAPVNWDYQAKIDPPPNCVTCKFPHESEIRIGVNNPLVPEEQWRNIGCEVCHRMEDNRVSPEVLWLDNSTGYYETIATNQDLCEKCHVTSGMIQRGILFGEHTHQGYSCTDCHDPHSTMASCVNSGCHANVLAESLLPSSQHANLTNSEQCLVCHTEGMQLHDMETQRTGNSDCLNCHIDMNNVQADQTSPPFHSKRHTRVDCVACHDASGMEVGLANNESRWTTFRTIQSPSGISTDVFSSHDLQKEVVCQKCHFEDNIWALPVINGQRK